MLKPKKIPGKFVGKYSISTAAANKNNGSGESSKKYKLELSDDVSIEQSPLRKSKTRERDDETGSKILVASNFKKRRGSNTKGPNAQTFALIN